MTRITILFTASVWVYLCKFIPEVRTSSTCSQSFSGGYVISAIFVCTEYQRLGSHFRQFRILRISFWMKLFFIFVEIGLVIGKLFFLVSFKMKYNTNYRSFWSSRSPQTLQCRSRSRVGDRAGLLLLRLFIHNRLHTCRVFEPWRHKAPNDYGRVSHE